MRIGIDIDGVLADFVTGFNALAKKEYNVDLPNPAPEWDWAKAGGLTSAQRNRLWELIKSTPFFGTLPPKAGAPDALDRLNDLAGNGHDVYFITTRPGVTAKMWSELWLTGHGCNIPTVLLAVNEEGKGSIAKGLGLDVFVDDKPENNLAVINATGRTSPIPGGGLKTNIRVYLVQDLYNEWAWTQPFNYGTPVSSLNAVLDIEFPREERRAA